MTVDVSAEHFTDPFSPWCWAAQPTLRRLRYDFEGVDWTPRMTVRLPTADALDEASRAGWAAAAAATGMPVAEPLWPDGAPGSRDACAVVAYVRETTPDRALAVLRRLRVAAFVEGRPPANPRAAAAVAGEVAGVDEEAVRRALADGRAEAALAVDLRRAVAVADELATVDVRGEIPRLRVAGRLDLAAEGGDAGAAAADRTAAEGGAGEAADAGGQDAESADVDGEHTDAEGEAPEPPTLVGPPALRVSSERVTVLDPRLAYSRVSSAFGRSVPDTGVDATDKFGTGRMAMHVPRSFAESLSARDFVVDVEAYLERFGAAYLAEIVEGTGRTEDTCRRSIRTLVERGRLALTDRGEWRIVEGPGGPANRG